MRPPLQNFDDRSRAGVDAFQNFDAYCAVAMALQSRRDATFAAEDFNENAVAAMSSRVAKGQSQQSLQALERGTG